MNKIYSFTDSVDAMAMPVKAPEAADGDHWHLGDADGRHYFSYNPATVTLQDNPNHDQKVHDTDEEKAALANVLPKLVYLQFKLQEMRLQFLSQYDEFTKLHALVNGTASFKAAVNSKQTEINNYIQSLGF